MQDSTLDRLRSALLEGIPLEGEAAAVAAFVEATPTRRSLTLRKIKVAAATVVGVLTLTTGLAAADALPGAAQDVAASALEKVGVNVPDNSDDHADTRGKSADHRQDGKPETEGHESGDHNGKGKTISSIAHDSTLEGVDKGAAVCTEASEAQCKAGQEHPGATVAGDEVEHPEGVEQGTEHSDGAGADGKATAEDHSGGRSSAGSGNAE
jgi:hypothetical protein